MYSVVSENFINELRFYLRTNKITQVNFAKQIGISLPTLSRLLNGHSRFLQDDTLERIKKIIPDICSELPSSEPPGGSYDLAKDSELLTLLLSPEYGLSTDDIRQILEWSSRADAAAVFAGWPNSPRSAVAALLALLVKSGGLSTPEPPPSAPGGPDPATK